MGGANWRVVHKNTILGECIPEFRDRQERQVLLQHLHTRKDIVLFPRLEFRANPFMRGYRLRVWGKI